MTFTDELLETVRSLWEIQLHHPFVQGIADGSLDETRFKRWIVQDYLYLVEFARVFAWATAKADSLDSMASYASFLRLTLETEISLHRRYATRFGVTAQELECAEMWPTTRAYTDFLVRTAAEGDLADLLAATLPCSWGYVYVAQKLATESPPADARYADWIEQYSCEEFVAAADHLRAELDRQTRGASDAKLARLKRLFVLSSQYELRFWDMCWHGESWDPEPD